MSTRVRSLCLVVAVVVGFATIETTTTAASAARKHLRLDTSLRAAIESGAHDAQRVIIRVRPDARAAVRRSLAAHGDAVLAEHESIDAITAVVGADELEAPASDDAIVGISQDAVVRPHGLLGLVGGLVGGVLNVVGDILQLPNGADTSGPVVTPAVLRQTLGVDGSSWTGRGVGVAVIDSGLEMSSEFSNRVTAFYDFTNGASAAATPSDEYGHGTHVAGTIGGSGALSYSAAY